MNLTTACQRQDTSCQVSCQDPKNPNQCIQLQSELIDGSSCGFGGTCKSGSCIPGSFLDTAKVGRALHILRFFFAYVGVPSMNRLGMFRIYRLPFPLPSWHLLLVCC